jgi:hypothetical protein
MGLISYHSSPGLEGLVNVSQYYSLFAKFSVHRSAPQSFLPLRTTRGSSHQGRRSVVQGLVDRQCGGQLLMRSERVVTVQRGGRASRVRMCSGFDCFLHEFIDTSIKMEADTLMQAFLPATEEVQLWSLVSCRRSCCLQENLARAQ